MNDKKIVFGLLATVGFVADFVTLAQFAFSGSALDFWTPKWYVTNCLIVTLTILMFSFLLAGDMESMAISLGKIMSFFYITSSAIIYLSMSVYVINSGVNKVDGEFYLSFSSWTGYIVFILLFFSYGLIIKNSLINDSEFLRFPSYVFALFSILVVCHLIWKYVFNIPEFYFLTVIADATQFLIGAIAFERLHVMSKG